MAAVAHALSELFREDDPFRAAEDALVIEDDTPVDNIFSEKQARLLTEPLYSSWAGPPSEDGVPRPFAALANVGLFSKLAEKPAVPDMMLSLDVSVPQDLSVRRNRTYFVWQYGKPPEVVVEVVSNTVGGELDKRFQHYRRIGVGYYVVFDPHRKLGGITLQAFERRGGMFVVLDRPWFEDVGLGLVEWEGAFEGVMDRWLRWATRDGKTVPTGAERAESEKARAESEKARAESAEAHARRLEARLREMGVDLEARP